MLTLAYDIEVPAQPAAVVAIRELPLAPAAAIVQAVIDRLAWPAALLTARERLVTDEGRFVALATLRGRGRAAAVAVLLGDAVALELVAVAPTAAAARAAVVAQARAASRTSGAGARRYFYAPPPGWQALERARATVWYPRAYPRHGAAILVLPAEPAGATAALAEELVAGASFPTDPRTRRTLTVTTARGLHGSVLRLRAADGGGRIVEAVVLSDSHLCYRVLFEGGAATRAADLALLERLIESIEPLPRRPSTQASVAALGHWE